MKQFLLLVILTLSSINIFSQILLTPDDLDMLDSEIEKVKSYDKIKYKTLDSLKTKFRSKSISAQERLKSGIRLGNEYESFISDSALVYYDKSIALAKQAGDSLGALTARIGRVKVLGVSGFYKEAVMELEEIEKAGVPNSLRNNLFDCARQVYVYMIGYTQSNNDYSSLYFRKNRSYRDSILSTISPESPTYKFYTTEVLQDEGKIALSRKELIDLMSKVPQNSALFARVTSALAGLAASENNMSSAAHYWALSAISDIKGSIKENTSLQNLATYLYSIGDFERAYKYICVSMDDANFCNARLRNMQIARNMPLINSAYKNEIESKQKSLAVVLLIVSILAIGLIVAVVLIWSQIKKLRVARKSLKRANKVKEEYMGHFLDLCSIYMERLDSFNKIVTRKASTGQIEDLIKMSKSPKFADEQNKLFYENFDSAFLHIYPNFVKDFNALLMPNEQIEIKEYGKLTMELRIFAFLRMGIDDSNKIASFLHYSVNTVYTYRNKIRNKAINRDTFDADIMEIGNLE